MLTNAEIISYSIEKLLPVSRKNFVEGLNLLMSYGDFKFINELSEIYGNMDLENINQTEIYNLLTHNVLSLSDRLGIVFMEEVGIDLIIARLDFIAIMDKPISEAESTEEYYAYKFAEEFRTSYGFELNLLYDTEELFDRQQELNDTFDLSMVRDNKDFIKKLDIFNSVITNIGIPEQLRNVSILEDMSIEYFQNPLLFEHLSVDEIAVSILLISILNETTRNLSKSEREELLEDFLNSIPEDKTIDVMQPYYRLVESFHNIGGYYEN